MTLYACLAYVTHFNHMTISIMIKGMLPVELLDLKVASIYSESISLRLRLPGGS